MIFSEHKERGRDHISSRLSQRRFVGELPIWLSGVRTSTLGANRSTNFGGEFHESKVAGIMASASNRVHWLDGILLCDFDGISIFIRLQWIKQLDVYLQRVLVEGSTTT